LRKSENEFNSLCQEAYKNLDSDANNENDLNVLQSQCKSVEAWGDKQRQMNENSNDYFQDIIETTKELSGNKTNRVIAGCALLGMAAKGVGNAASSINAFINSAVNMKNKISTEMENANMSFQGRSQFFNRVGHKFSVLCVILFDSSHQSRGRPVKKNSLKNIIVTHV